MNNNNYYDDDMKPCKLHVSKFLHEELKVCTRSFSIFTARYEPMSYCWSVLNAS